MDQKRRWYRNIAGMVYRTLRGNEIDSVTAYQTQALAGLIVKSSLTKPLARLFTSE